MQLKLIIVNVIIDIEYVRVSFRIQKPEEENLTHQKSRSESNENENTEYHPTGF